MTFELEPSWQKILSEELSAGYMQDLEHFLEEEREAGHKVYPPLPLIFNAFQMTPYDKVKVVILGQDPYHGPGQAHGLSFSVPEGVSLPPSLKNIFKELAADLGVQPSSNGCLEAWARQGVLLLNATLTVRDGEPLSHAGRGWERFTDAVISKLCLRKEPVIFALWGKFAQEKASRIPEMSHSHCIVLTAAHPSPFSARNGFFGCGHFSKINQLLQKMGKKPIVWELKNTPAKLERQLELFS